MGLWPLKGLSFLLTWSSMSRSVRLVHPPNCDEAVAFGCATRKALGLTFGMSS